MDNWEKHKKNRIEEYKKNPFINFADSINRDTIGDWFVLTKGGCLTIPMTGVTAGSRIWLTGIVGWQDTSSSTMLEIQVLRGASLIFSVNEHGAGNNRFSSTSINHVDLTPGTGNVSYSLVALTTAGTASAVGAINITGALIEP